MSLHVFVFLGAFLLFQVQPLTAGRLLPVFGGGPVVWSTSLVGFQALLVAGYALAAGVPMTRWRRLLLPGAACALAITLASPGGRALSGADWPVLRLGMALLLEAGAPYLLLAAGAPLLTRVALDSGRSPADLHRLYAVSNAGSVVGLLAGPVLLDLVLSRSAQRGVFLIGFGVWAVGVAVHLRRARVQAFDLPARASDGVSGPSARPWLWNAALGTALLTTVTAWLSQDLSVTPLLWVLPLLVYLLTFIAAFGLKRLPGRGPTTAALAVGMAVLVALLEGGWRLGWPWQLGGALVVLAVGAFSAHAELVRLRPAAEALPRFYLVLSIGGALGSLTAGLLVPALVNVPLELPMVAALTWLTAARSLERAGRAEHPLRPPELLRNTLVGVSLAVLAGLGHFAHVRTRGDATWARSVFGALQVRNFGAAGPPEDHLRNLLDGRISHGFQYLAPERRREPTTYFAAESGIGRLLARPGPPRQVAVLGLGIGTLAAWGRAGDRFRFYEINPAAIDVAQRDFTFLGDSAAQVEVVQGDARVTLEAERDTPWDVIVVDAFSGDAIPVHLITEEAIALYLCHLASDGVLAINVSNNHADLTRVVGAHAESFGLASAWRRGTSQSPLGPYRSDWAFLAFESDALRMPGEGALPPLPDAPPVRFTDDRAPLLSILR